MGIQVKFDGNYKPLSIKGDNSADYWNVKYQLGENPESVFPQAEPQQGENGELESVEFSAVNLYGREALRNSKDISQTRVPKSEVERIQRELESLHALAENPNVPEERRNFYRNLRLPDPSQIPFAWRISGLFRKHLHILWGFGTSRNGDGTFLPKTTKSEKSPTNPEENWPDNHLRYSIKDILSPANGSSRLSSWSFTPLAYFLLLLLIIGLLFIGWRYGIPLMNNLLAGSATDTTTSQEQKKTLNPKPGEKDGNSDSKNNISNDPQAGEKGGSSGTKENIINDPQAGEKGGNSGTKDNITNDPQAGEKDGNSDSKKNLPSNTTPRKNAPAIADYTFSIQLGQVTKQGDIAAALFNVVPDKSMGNQKFVVHSWSVNGKQMLAGDNKSFSCKRLSYKERYVITASVTVNGKAQKVLPYQWNNIDTPVWMIIRAGNNDNEYLSSP